LNVSAVGSVDGSSYDINGKAVADLLNAGDFEINTLQLMGNVMGTGTDFRWVGELRAVAERSYGTTLTGLILRDARAEMNKGVLTASSPQFTANGLATSGARADGIAASDLRLRKQDDVMTATIASVKAGEITASGARVQGVTANNVDVVDRGGVTNVTVNNVQVGATTAAGAEIGSLNIAGVRLSVRNRRIEGSTADIDAGTVKLPDDGRAENVKLARPVFVVEPSGSYRASADLSIGGGVLGKMELGQARASVVATNREIQLNNFSAEAFDGRASGNARIGLARGATSQVAAEFNNVDVAGPLAAIAGTAVPLTGRATGRVDLTFPGTEFKLASGTLTTRLSAETGQTSADRIPITGEVSVRANQGLFDIQAMNLQTPATKLNATGRFSFEGDSNLTVDLASSDAAELQTVLISSGLLPSIEDEMDNLKLGIAGQLTFNGNIRGRLENPDVNGRFSLGSVLVQGVELGSVTATITMNSQEIRIPDGRLVERDGGGMQFLLVMSRTEKNKTSIDATLDRMNAAALLALSPTTSGHANIASGTEGDLSGRIKIDGIPNAMSGAADLRLGSGRLGGEPLQSMTARATFSGPNVNIESVDIQFVAGHIVGSGTFNNETKDFDLQGRAENFQLARLTTLTSAHSGVAISGVASFNAQVKGNLNVEGLSGYQITFDGAARQVTINGRSAGDLALKGTTQNDRLNITLTSSILGAPQVVTAEVNLADEYLASKIDTTFTNADLTNLFGLIMPGAGVRISGRANGTISASGNLLDDYKEFSIAGLSGTARFSELSFRVEDVQLTATTPLEIAFKPNEINFKETRFTGPGTNILIDGMLASGAGGAQNLNVNGSLNLRVLNGVSPDFFSSGTAQVAVTIRGSYEAPRVNGQASLDNASVSILLGNDRWTVANLRGGVRFTTNQAQIDSITGTLGGGRVEATGGALLDGFTVSAFRVNLRGDEVTVPFPENFRSTLDADVEIRGSSREQLIGGVVTLRRAEYTEDIELADLIDTRRQSIEEGAEIELTRTALFASLRVEGRNALVVRNNLADLVGSVSLQLDGPVNDPTISGRITATSGTLNFRNDRYDITRALVDLPPARNADPVLNIQAEGQLRGYRVIVGLTGPLTQPQATVRSEPALPQADVVSLITTGQLSSGDTSTSILSQSEVGAATSLLTDALINAPAQRATSKLFGLTRFEISPVIGGTAGSTPAARLTLGRRISKEVTVTYSTNVTSDPNQILALEYRVSDRLSFVAQYEQASTRRLSARTNNFNFEIRFRKRF
jgi:translocation and assembly module TamB